MSSWNYSLRYYGGRQQAGRHMAEIVPGVHIAHEAFLLAAVRIGQLTGLMARQALAL